MLRILDVVKTWRTRSASIRAVDHVTLELEKPSLFALLGPNGAGKTTLLNIVAGIVPPDQGRVEIMGIDMWREPEKAKRLIGFSPQEGGVFMDLTVWENLMYAATMHRIPSSDARKRAKELIEFLGLEEHVKKLAKKLSGGLRKRLSVAMSLMHDPPILILDEPTTGLDPRARIELVDLLRKLVSRGKLVVMSTHITEDAERSDVVGFMFRGRIVEMGSPDQVKERTFGKVRVIEIEVLEDNAREKLAKVLRDQGRDARIGGTTIELVSSNVREDLDRVLELAERMGVRILETRIREPRLSDVFLKLTGVKLGEEQ